MADGERSQGRHLSLFLVPFPSLDISRPLCNRYSWESLHCPHGTDNQNSCTRLPRVQEIMKQTEGPASSSWLWCSRCQKHYPGRSEHDKLFSQLLGMSSLSLLGKLGKQHHFYGLWFSYTQVPSSKWLCMCVSVGEHLTPTGSTGQDQKTVRFLVHIIGLVAG